MFGDPYSPQVRLKLEMLEKIARLPKMKRKR